MMQLIPTDVRRVAIVGLAKNTGKTTVLNALLQAGQQDGKRFGVLSVGVDGEQRDVWDLHDKPAIEVWPGVWAATARAAINESSAHLTIVRELKPSSPLGPVYLVRCTQPGRLKLAGTHTLADVHQAMAHFEEYGADLSIVDGAYDRLAAAGPDVCQGVVLCTGAAVDARVEVAMRKTEEVLAKWQLPQWTDNGSHLLHPRHPGQTNEQCLSNKIEEPREVLYLAEGKWRTLGTSSLLAGLTLLRERVAKGGVGAVSLPGALTDWTLAPFEHVQRPFDWIVGDPTKVFVPLERLKRWYRQGGGVYVRRKSRLLALAVNPTSPYEQQDPHVWLAHMRRIAGEIPVWDVLRPNGLHTNRCFRMR